MRDVFAPFDIVDFRDNGESRAPYARSRVRRSSRRDFRFQPFESPCESARLIPPRTRHVRAKCEHAAAFPAPRGHPRNSFRRNFARAIPENFYVSRHFRQNHSCRFVARAFSLPVARSGAFLTPFISRSHYTPGDEEYFVPFANLSSLKASARGVSRYRRRRERR